MAESRARTAASWRRIAGSPRIAVWWLTNRLEAESGASVAQRQATIDEIVRLGDPAIPRLVEMLSSPDESTREDARQTLVGIGEPAVADLTTCFAAADARTREAAGLALVEVGEPGIPALVRFLDSPDEEVKLASERALVAVDPIARPLSPQAASMLMSAFGRCLGSVDREVSTQAVGCIGTVHRFTGGRATDVVPGLLRMMSVEPDRSRAHTIRAML